MIDVSPKSRAFAIRLLSVLTGIMMLAGLAISSSVQAQMYEGMSGGRNVRPGGGGGGRSGVGGAAVGVGIGIGTAVILNEAAKAAKKNKTKAAAPKRKRTKKAASKPKTKKPAKKTAKKKAPTKNAAPAPAAVPDFVTGEILLVFAPDASDASINQFVSEYGLTAISNATIALLNQRIVRARLPNGISAERTLQISNDPRVSMQPNYLYEVTGDQKVQYAVVKLGVREVHRTNRGEGILVAVIDSGVNAGHPALKGAVLEEFEAVKVKKGSADTHGTAVASIIAARDGMTGVAPQAMLLSVKAFAPDSKYGRALGNTYDLLRGIDWAVKKHAQVLNLSFAGPRDPLLQAALDAAAERGVVLVGAAGNKGPKAPPAYPGAYEQVIAATATDAKDRLYKMANRGDYVAIAAPGVDILTAVGSKGFGVTSGTSMAAAYVSGSVALVIQASPQMTSQEAFDRIAATAKDLGENGKDPAFGHGLLNVYRAVGGDQVTLGQANQKDPAN